MYISSKFYRVVRFLYFLFFWVRVFERVEYRWWWWWWWVALTPGCHVFFSIVFFLFSLLAYFFKKSSLVLVSGQKRKIHAWPSPSTSYYGRRGALVMTRRYIHWSKERIEEPQAKLNGKLNFHPLLIKPINLNRMVLEYQFLKFNHFRSEEQIVMPFCL